MSKPFSRTLFFRLSIDNISFIADNFFKSISYIFNLPLWNLKTCLYKSKILFHRCFILAFVVSIFCVAEYECKYIFETFNLLFDILELAFCVVL